METFHRYNCNDCNDRSFCEIGPWLYLGTSCIQHTYTVYCLCMFYLSLIGIRQKSVAFVHIQLHVIVKQKGKNKMPCVREEIDSTTINVRSTSTINHQKVK